MTATAEPVSTAANSETYDELIFSALRVAALVLTTKFLAVIALAKQADESATITRMFGIIPRLNFSADPATVSRIATLSTLAMAVVALAIGAWTMLRPSVSNHRVWGRCVAGVIALQTLAFEGYRHLQGDDTLAPRFALLVVLSGTAAIALLGLNLWRDRTTELPETEHVD